MRGVHVIYVRVGTLHVGTRVCVWVLGIIKQSKSKNAPSQETSHRLFMLLLSRFPFPSPVNQSDQCSRFSFLFSLAYINTS